MINRIEFKKCRWHNMSVSDVCKLLETSCEGLSENEAEIRFRRNGPNELLERKRKDKLNLFLEQFKDIMVLILFGAAIIAGIMGDVADAIVILVIVFFNAMIGFYQELRAENAISILKKKSVNKVTVLRNRKVTNLLSTMLVKGDVVLLEAGNEVPADLRIIESVNLKIEEAALTGESLSIDKVAETLEQADLLFADRNNLAYKGTFVSYGHGRGIVIATGMDTEMGKIALMLQRESPLTPLQQRMSVFSKKLTLLITFVCIVFFVTGWSRGEDTLKMLLTSISLAVAAIPEALPAVITISLALAARKLIKFNALVRKLTAVETLGSVNFICTDKTGTLTQNRMTVVEICFGNEYYIQSNFKSLQKDPIGILLLYAFALNNDVVKDLYNHIKGDSTEIALREVVNGIDFPPINCPRLAEIPFDADRKVMTTFHEIEGKIISFTKGAPDILLQKCKDNNVETWHKHIKHMAQKGERVLGFAYQYWKELPGSPESDIHESDLIFLGLCGLVDPPRKEVTNAVAKCKAAGIIPVMITGDHIETANYIARKTGIIGSDIDLSITGSELLAIGDKDFSEIVTKIKVYARVNPDQKLRIVTALQNAGNYVAMTGDGINDAPSLKAANIGIAMGISGTDVAKDASDIILLDDSFTSIINAIRAGRQVYDNILKLITYLLTTNLSEILILLLGPLLGLPIAFLPIHILWINLMSDGLPALSLSFERAEKDIMTRSPGRFNEPIFSSGRWVHMIWVGLLMAGTALYLQSLAYRSGLRWQTMVFNMICLCQMGHAISVRSSKSIFQNRFFSNKPMILSIFTVLVLQLVITYIPIFQPIFHTQSLTFIEFLTVGCASLIVFFIVEFQKSFFK